MKVIKGKERQFTSMFKAANKLVTENKTCGEKNGETHVR